MHCLRLFLCGDVMTGRGIDQVLPYPGDPQLHEPYVTDAREYVILSERRYGPIPKPVDFEYIWGDAIPVWSLLKPDLKIVNLETAVTRSNVAWPAKGISYRMAPENIGCLRSAGIDFCALANNHVLDWGYSGLNETLETLHKANIRYAGAGEDLCASSAPAIMAVNAATRVLAISLGWPSSGIPQEWAAAPGRPGINLLSPETDNIEDLFSAVSPIKNPGDILIASIHWGPNWGYKIPQSHVRFAHDLIDNAGVDIIHGHSSHHALGIEVYEGHLILYGCGDLLNDYEGISGYEDFRGDLGLMYFADVDEAGKLVALQMVPMRMQQFRLIRTTCEEMIWLANTLKREGNRFGTSVELDQESGRLVLKWI